MRQKMIYKTWLELNDDQKKQVVVKLGKLSKEEGEVYLKKPGMKYSINEQGQATGGYIDPYLLSNIF